MTDNESGMTATVYVPAPLSAFAGPKMPQVPTRSPTTSDLAILALVAGLVLPPVGIVLGAVALARLEKSGKKGSALAFAGLATGVIGVLLLAAAFVAASLFATTGA